MIAEGGGLIHFLYAQKKEHGKMPLFTVTPRGGSMHFLMALFSKCPTPANKKF